MGSKVELQFKPWSDASPAEYDLTAVVDFPSSQFKASDLTTATGTERQANFFPYRLIYTYSDLETIAKEVNAGRSKDANDIAYSYALTSRINDSATTEERADDEFLGFTPIGTSTNPFKGNFDGNYHWINDLHIKRSASTEPVGLFGHLSDSVEIKNLVLRSPAITGNYYVGSIAGMSDAKTILDNIKVNSLVLSGNYIGGLIGKISGDLLLKNSDVLSLTSNTTTSTTGGFIGGMLEGGEIKDCKLKDSAISGVELIGGITGFVNAVSSDDLKTSFENIEIENLTLNINNSILDKAGHVAGIVALIKSQNNSITDSKIKDLTINSTGDYAYYLGGACGQSQSNAIENNNIFSNITVTNFTVSPAVSSEDKIVNVGGVVGSLNARNIVKNCTVETASLSATKNLGGITGELVGNNNSVTNNIVKGVLSEVV